MWGRRFLQSSLFLLLLCLSVSEVVPSRGAEAAPGVVGVGGGLASWVLGRGGDGRGAWTGASCWGPGVWPHPSHCSLFSICRMTDLGVKGVLLRCPAGTAFVSRRWRCYPDERTNCAQRPIAKQLLKVSMEMRIPKFDLSSRIGVCPFPKPYCSSETTLTVCAPNHHLIGNVTCPSGCTEDEFGAFCDPAASQGTTTTPATTTSTTTTPTTTTSSTTTTSKPTTAKYSSEALPILDANLMESAIKITSSLGLGPAHKDTQGNRTSQNPSGVKKPGIPAYTSPVFDLNGSPEEYSYESEQAEEEKPVFSKPTVVEQGSQGPTTVSPLPNGNKDSQVFTIEKVQPSAGAVSAQLSPAGVGATGGGPSKGTTTTERSVEQDAEKDKLEGEKLEKEKAEKEKLEKEKLEKEKAEREKLEKEKLELEKLEREKAEKEKMEREKLEKLEREKIEREKLEKEKLERERLEKEKLERERLEKEKLERERLEKEKLERERLEKEKLERERLEKEKLEREKKEKEKLEREKLEREGLEKEKLEREKLAKEKLEKEKLEMERLEKEKLEKIKLEFEKKEREKLEAEKNRIASSETVTEKTHGASTVTHQDLATVCTRPGLTCVNSNVLLECSPDLVPLRAWNCASFFSRSATLFAKCDRERDSCVATVDDENVPDEEEHEGFAESRPLCKRPGAQCADKSTLIHCSGDMRSATVAVCTDLFPGVNGGAFCDQALDACVVRIGEDEQGYSNVQITHTNSVTTTEISTQPVELLTSAEVTTPRSPLVGSTANPSYVEQVSTQEVVPVTEKFPGKPYPSNDPNDTLIALFPMLRDQCRKPGLRCYGGRVLEACEKDNPKPVYRMDCAAVLADSLGARCEEQNEGEATCIVALRRNVPLLKEGLDDSPLKEDEIFTLELSVIDVTRTFEYDDSEIPPWRCSRVGQYCADDSTLLSCNADFTLEFALSCGAIAPQSVVAFCDHSRDACVVKKISDLTSGPVVNASFLGVTNEAQNKTSIVSQAGELSSSGQQTEKLKPYSSTQEFLGSYPVNIGAEQIGSETGPTKWDFSTISQLYPPNVPLGAYSAQPLAPQTTFQDSIQYSSENLLQSNCTKVGPVCLDAFHLGSCSEEMELRFVLPCSALYTTDPAPYCDSGLSACLPSGSRQTTTTKASTITDMTTENPATTTVVTSTKEPTTTTVVTSTKEPTTTTLVTSTKEPTSTTAATTDQPFTFTPQQIPSYHLYEYPATSGSQYGAPSRNPTIQENQFNNLPNGHLQIPQVDSSFPRFPFLRPESYTFFQRPGVGNQYPTQLSRLPAFLQNILQNYGIRWPSFSQTVRPPTLSSFPLLNNLFQGFSTLRPPGILQQNTEYGLYGERDPYDYNDPQYQHYAGTYSNAYAPVAYQSILPGTQLIKVERPVATLSGGVSPDMHSDILKYYTNVLTAANQRVKQSPSGSSSNLFKNRPKPQKPLQSYLDRFLDMLQQHNYGQAPLGGPAIDIFKSKLSLSSGVVSPAAHAGGSSSITSQPDAGRVNIPTLKHSSGPQGSISSVNPLTWVGKLEVPDAEKTSVCQRPGMQCVDSESLGACSKELKLRYVIPCRNLLPFVSVGKPYCDSGNDACGVLVEEEQSEYPTDFTSYP